MAILIDLDRVIIRWTITNVISRDIPILGVSKCWVLSPVLDTIIIARVGSINVGLLAMHPYLHCSVVVVDLRLHQIILILSRHWTKIPLL